MPVRLTKADQPTLLATALAVNGSTGWKSDALAFGALRDGDVTPRAIGVFQCFAGGEAELHFSMLEGKVSAGIMEAFAMVAGHHNGLNLNRVWTHVVETNIVAQRAALGAGFQFEYRKRGGPNESRDVIVFSIARETGFAPARAS